MEEQVQVTTTKSELNNLSIKDLFFKYVRFLPLFIISIALALFGAFLYLRYTTPIYQSAGQLIVKDDQNSRGGDERFEQLLNTGGTRNIQSEIEYIRSRPLMERVVRNLNLNFSYYAVGKIREIDIYRDCPFYVEAFEIYDSTEAFAMNLHFKNSQSFTVNDDGTTFNFGQVFKNQWGVFRLMKDPDGGYTAYDFKVLWQPTSQRAGGLIGSLVVAPKGQNTGILILTHESTSPRLSADVINELMDVYQQATREDKNLMNQQTRAFIDDRLDVIENELDSVNRRLLAYQQATNSIDLDAQSANYFNLMQETDKAIIEERKQLEVAQSINAYLRQRQNDFTTVPSSLGLQDQTLNNLIATYNLAQLQRKELIDGNVPRGNIDVQQKEGQIEKLRTTILENLQNIIRSLNGSINSLQGENSQVQAQIRSLPVKQQNLIEIRRQQESKLAVYNFLMEKREETAISSAATISNIKELEQAHPNYIPVSPKKRNIQMLAILIGVLLPALSIFAAEILNDKVTTRNDIERITSATILGEVGHSFGKGTLVVKQNTRSVIAEQFRIIRSNFQYVIHNVEKPVVLITSSFSGEGKSFISTNIGGVMALAGKRTIILEFDIRKPKILSGLDIPKKPGLTNYLLGKATLAELPVAVPDTENLFILPCGPIPPNPSELLLDAKLSDLFIYLKQNFDIVIMDTAPVGMVSDAMTLSKFADATLYIVRQGHTYKKQIGLVDEFYRDGKLPKLSIIVNDVKLQTGYGYYGYGRYGYGQSYGSGYFEDETPPPNFLNRWFGWMDISKWKKKRRRK